MKLSTFYDYDFSSEIYKIYYNFLTLQIKILKLLKLIFISTIFIKIMKKIKINIK